MRKTKTNKRAGFNEKIKRFNINIVRYRFYRRATWMECQVQVAQRVFWKAERVKEKILFQFKTFVQEKHYLKKIK